MPEPAISDLPAPERAALCLDFDGTLVPIAPRPDAIRLPDSVLPLLAQAFDRLSGRVAIISGRSLRDLEHYLPGFRGQLIGSHGAERRGRPAPDIDTEGLDRIRAAITHASARWPGSLIEDKPTGIVLHYRDCPDAADPMLAMIKALLSRENSFALQPAIMAWDIKMKGARKDYALQGLLEETVFQGALPVFAGDDENDETALACAQQLGGTAIKIGGADSVAQYRLPDPAALIRLLQRWLA